VLADALVERGDDLRDGVALLRGERLGLRLAAQGLALGGRGPLAARRAAARRDELERPRRRRAVVVGDPQGEVDERARHLVQQPAHRRRLDPGRRLDADVGDDAAGGAPPEPDRHDRALREALGHLVGERPGERPRRHERVDGRERHDRARYKGG
jgi:hypothetical protein